MITIEAKITCRCGRMDHCNTESRVQAESSFRSLGWRRQTNLKGPYTVPEWRCPVCIARPKTLAAVIQHELP